MELLVGQFLLFIAIFARITSLIVVAPLFGHESIPVQTKAGLGAFISFVMYPMVAQHAPSLDLELLPFFILVSREVMVGLLLGFAVGIIFGAIQYAGELISFSLGLSAAMMFSPEDNDQTPIVGEFMYLFAMLVFLLINGHHFVLEALRLTYSTVPIGTLGFAVPLLEKMTAFGSLMFVVAVKISAPVLVAEFLTNVGLSVLARVMPQMNIFIVSFPLSIGVGFLVLLSSAPFMVFIFKKLLLGFEDNILELVNVL
ncbi:MAG TPA: flagellar biosynthetic protein FliR [Bacteroidota bacterium]|nr:flagellar biosynthetic protein FliR [Bacteroidota bacterium]